MRDGTDPLDENDPPRVPLPALWSGGRALVALLVLLAAAIPLGRRRDLRRE